MNFELDAEQALLRDTTRELLARAYDVETRNAVSATARGWNPAVWNQFADLGLLGLPFPESAGGMGAGPVETMTVMTEIGRALAPEPFLDTVVICGGLIADAGSPTQHAHYLPLVAEGAILVAFAHSEPGSRWPHEDVATSATRTSDGWVITGTKNPVLRGDCADDLIVTAALPDGGIGLFLAAAEGAGVSRNAYATHDGLGGAQITFAATPAVPLGNGGDASAAVTGTQVRAQTGLCAEAIGVMTEALRLTVVYLKQRKQFGVPLASFQTLTQRAADMCVAGVGIEHELARHHVAGRRRGRPPRRLARQAADQWRRAAYRPGSHPDARRHRYHRRVSGRSLCLTPHRDRTYPRRRGRPPALPRS